VGKAKAEKPAKKPTEKDVLAVMQKLTENGIEEVTSRLISDKLGFADADKGRGRIRVLMKKLEKAGKISVEKKAVKEKGARKQYVYTLKESGAS